MTMDFEDHKPLIINAKEIQTQFDIKCEIKVEFDEDNLQKQQNIVGCDDSINIKREIIVQYDNLKLSKQKVQDGYSLEYIKCEINEEFNQNEILKNENENNDPLKIEECLSLIHI